MRKKDLCVYLDISVVMAKVMQGKTKNNKITKTYLNLNDGLWCTIAMTRHKNNGLPPHLAN